MSQPAEPEPTCAAVRRQGYAPALVALIAGTAVSLAVAWGFRRGEWHRIQIEFAAAAHDRCRAVEKNSEEHQLILESVRSLFAASERVERHEFRAFTAPLLSRRPGIQALGWIPRVPGAQRAEYEEGARKDGLESFQISEADDLGHTRRAAQRPEYFPVYYIEPRRGNEAAVGSDLASSPARLEALRRAMDSGQAAATARIALLGTKDKGFGFLMFLPFYAPGMPADTVPERRQALRGFVLAVFRLPEIVETALDPLHPAGVDIRLEDVSALAGERFLYFHPSRTRQGSFRPAAGEGIHSLDDVQDTQQYEIGGRTWQMFCTPAAGYVSARRTWQPWATLAGGLAFTGLLTTYYFASIRRAVRTQRALGENESRYRSLFHGSPISLREEDYTEVKSQLDRLRAAGVADFREYFHNHPEAVRECAAKVRLIDLNQAALRLFGAASKQELLGGLPAVFTDETYETFRDGLIAMGEGRTVFDIESPIRTIQGEEKQVLLRWAAAPGSELMLDRVYISQTDITERKRVEQALHESESRFRGVIETSPDAIVMLALDGRTLLANQQAARVLGFPSVAEMLANVPNTFQVLAPEDRPRAAERVRELIEAGILRDHQYSAIRRDGSCFTVEVSSSLQRDFSGNPQAMIVVLRDITERKQAEQLLRQAKDAAEAANRAKSEFLANMSHEIRTPMTAILGFTDLLTRPDLSHGKKNEFLQVIRRNGKALLKLINDILDLSKIEAEKLTLDKGDCPLQQIVRDVMSVARIQAEAKKLALQVDYEFPLPERIHTDPVRLRQILVNLLGNAVKFTQRGAVRLAVRCLRGNGGAAQMEFAVSDTGIGIPPDKIAELFQPFMQADASATRRYGGTGLGLAISKRLANALGGDIQVSSELGNGSTFTVTIQVGSLQGVSMLQTFPAAPAAREEPPLGGAPAQRVGGSAGQRVGQPTLHGRLLLAEDSPDVQLLVRNLLGAMGLKVEIADNGQTACDMARQAKAAGRPYDLILMDIQMPQRNGYEATAWLRQHGWQGPIVAMTAHAMVGDREKCLAAGCNDYLAKPLTAAALRDVLARHLGPAAALR
jgi:PAS domain S-box-containing protein